MEGVGYRCLVGSRKPFFELGLRARNGWIYALALAMLRVKLCP